MSKTKQIRQAKILAEINDTPSLRIAELARRHHVSTETIRRDLDALTQGGHLSRTYGGAIRAQSSEPSINERHQLFVAERERIARETVKQLTGAHIVMIGAGATTVHVARRISSDMKNLSVITYSFGVATVLSMNPTIKVIIAPGEYESFEGSVVGALTINFLHQYFVDYAILGASGVSAEGPSAALIDCGTVYRTMSQSAAVTLVVADHSKFGMTLPSRYALWPQITRLITDKQPDRPLRENLHEPSVGLYDRIAERAPYGRLTQRQLHGKLA